MTWSEWIRSVLRFEDTKREQLRDMKLVAYLTAMLTRAKRLPSLMSWMTDQQTRPVFGAERMQLQAERAAIEPAVMEYLQSRKAK